MPYQHAIAAHQHAIAAHEAAAAAHEAAIAAIAAHEAIKAAIAAGIEGGYPEAHVARLHDLLATAADLRSGLAGYVGVDEEEGV